MQDLRGNFIPGSSGADWPYPNGQDLNRLKTQEQRAEENKMLWEHSKSSSTEPLWKSLSWSQVNCSQRLVDKSIWEDISTGVPDCFCRDRVDPKLQQSAIHSRCVKMRCATSTESLERAICISSSLEMHTCGTPNRPCARASIRAMEEAGSTSQAVAKTLSQGLRGKTLTAVRQSVRNSLVAYQCHTCIFV